MALIFHTPFFKIHPMTSSHWMNYSKNVGLHLRGGAQLCAYAKHCHTSTFALATVYLIHKKMM
ncbi:MAG: hypothetical protein WHV28_08105 [Bacteroidota bacterium]